MLVSDHERNLSVLKQKLSFASTELLVIVPISNKSYLIIQIMITITSDKLSKNELIRYIILF